MVDSGQKSLAHFGVSADGIFFVVPHQANIRIIQAACDRLGVRRSNGPRWCWTAPATPPPPLPLALAGALDAGRVKKGDLVLLVGFGAGTTAASAILRWSGDDAEALASDGVTTGSFSSPEGPAASAWHAPVVSPPSAAM
ncbi:MAG: 3-oxoacyl-[acyl-carrier-protein] synthase III C-terminal domain-containing protein [Ilumatobacteraceae bacterium]